MFTDASVAAAANNNTWMLLSAASWLRSRRVGRRCNVGGGGRGQCGGRGVWIVPASGCDDGEGVEGRGDQAAVATATAVAAVATAVGDGGGGNGRSDGWQ